MALLLLLHHAVAFDSTNNGTILIKMAKTGIESTALWWFQIRLPNRYWTSVLPGRCQTTGHKIFFDLPYSFASICHHWERLSKELRHIVNMLVTSNSML